MAVSKHYDLDTDNTLSGNSDVAIASQKAVKSYVDTGLAGKQDTLTTEQTTEMTLEETTEVTLSTVATSGSYNDLSNRPTIPTVNDGTITITQGGTTKGTFTVNQSGNTTVALDGSGPTWTLTDFINNTGTTLDTQMTLHTGFSVFRNGVLLTATTDYTYSGTVITFVIALQTTDIIKVLNSDIALMALPSSETVTSTTPSLAVERNTNYICSNALTSLTISSAPNSVLESNIYFTTGSSFSFTNSSSITKWLIDTPTFATSKSYVINISNGVMAYAEIVQG